MNLIKSIAILFFDFLDKFIHQQRILNNLKRNKLNIKLFFDVGSHKGLYSDLILKNFNVNKVFMFEPQREIFTFIKKKYKNNKKIKLYNYAASNYTKKKKIYINKHDLTSSLTKLNHENVYLKFKSKLFGGSIKKMIANSYKVQTIKLIDLIKKEKIKNIDLLKIDTEGHELEVLLGLGKEIQIIQIILIEFHNDNIYLNYSNNKIHNYLLKRNFFLQKKIKFPFTEWEDRIYINDN
tara:strand:- start:4148 stop:4858 length:711 start_codon:yes stop_codon:yes gene_type:complete